MSISREEVFELLRKAIVDSDDIDSFIDDIEEMIESYDDSNQAMIQLKEALDRLALQLDRSNALTHDIQARLKRMGDFLKKG